MSITFTLSEEDYQMLIQMLVNSNPLIQKIAQQANPQIQAAQAKASEGNKPVSSFERERERRDVKQ